MNRRLYTLAEEKNWQELSNILLTTKTVTPSEIQYQDNEMEVNTFWFTCSYNAPIEIVESLIEYGSDLETTNTFGETALVVACWNNVSLEIIHSLLKHGANIHHVCNDGTTPLVACCRMNSSIEIVKLLLQYGANDKITTYQNKPPIEIAQERSFIDIVNILSNWPPAKSVVEIS
jgi:hypothetical protein